MGIPVPGQKFNWTKVEEKDLYTFDTQFLELFTPYNVLMFKIRTPIVSTQEWECQTKEVMSSAKTFCQMLKE